MAFVFVTVVHSRAKVFAIRTISGQYLRACYVDDDFEDAAFFIRIRDAARRDAVNEFWFSLQIKGRVSFLFVRFIDYSNATDATMSAA